MSVSISVSKDDAESHPSALCFVRDHFETEIKWSDFYDETNEMNSSNSKITESLLPYNVLLFLFFVQ